MSFCARTMRTTTLCSAGSTSGPSRTTCCWMGSVGSWRSICGATPCASGSSSMLGAEPAAEPAAEPGCRSTHPPLRPVRRPPSCARRLVCPAGSCVLPGSCARPSLSRRPSACPSCPHRGRVPPLRPLRCRALFRAAGREIVPKSVDFPDFSYLCGPMQAVVGCDAASPH